MYGKSLFGLVFVSILLIENRYSVAQTDKSTANNSQICYFPEEIDSLIKTPKFIDLGDLAKDLSTYGLGKAQGGNNSTVFCEIMLDLAPIGGFLEAYLSYSRLLPVWWLTSDTGYVKSQVGRLLTDQSEKMVSCWSECQESTGRWKTKDEFVSKRLSEMFDVMTYLRYQVYVASVATGFSPKDEY